MNGVILLVRDGWGYRKQKKHNAIASTHTPHTDKLMKNFPHILVDAAGKAVGLPDGCQGNSEVGHLTMGSGRIIFQPLARINKSIESGEFFKNPVLLKAIQNCKKKNSVLHLAGLLQTEGVHSHVEHLYALLELCKKQGFKDVLLHVFTDGRDAPVNAGKKKIILLKKRLKLLGFGEIATVCGRYYAMDRNRNWSRTKKAFGCIALGKADNFEDAAKQVKECYGEGETDEFIVPRKKKGYPGVRENDSFVFFNFRTDRTRQLTQAMVEPVFSGWKRKPLKIFFVAMTQYYASMKAHIAFENIPLKNTLGELVSRAGFRQLRISETEKYAHVTFFFNGQQEKPFRGEHRILVPSPNVPTYDLKPEMSAFKVTEKLVKEIGKGIYSLIVVNIVNCDMVGHTGNTLACRKAVKVVDECVGKITSKALEEEYASIVFADHGNIEDQTKKWRTSHTTNLVPLILVSSKKHFKLRKHAGLKDIAPTVLFLLGMKKPREMAGKSLVL